MSVEAIIEDGKIVNGTTNENVNKAKTKKSEGSSMDKDTFMQILVAQMKYQDPLEPTSNTEYISQYATFSELEQMQNMSGSLELSRASAMVGKNVVIHQTSADTGETKEIEGKVDYVTYENGKAYLSVNGSMYEASDIYATVDDSYKTATDLALAFATALGKLPAVENLRLEDKDSVLTLTDGFNKMTSYQQSFIPDDLIETLTKYATRMKELVDGAEAANNNDEGENNNSGEEENGNDVGDAT